MKRWIYFFLLVAGTAVISIHILPKVPYWLLGLHSEYSDPAKPVRVVSGRQFVLALKSNRSAGYGWQFASPLDKDYLKVIEIHHGTKQTKLTAAGSVDRWTFQALRPGQTMVAFEYVRLRENEAPPVQTAVFEVFIEHAGKNG